MGTRPNRTTNVSDSPTAWFAVLERARLDGDFELAAKAQRELNRLGVTVRFCRTVAKRKAVRHDR